MKAPEREGQPAGRKGVHTTLPTGLGGAPEQNDDPRKDLILCSVCLQWSCDGPHCHRPDVYDAGKEATGTTENLTHSSSIDDEPLNIRKYLSVDLAQPAGIGEIVDVVARAMEVFGDRAKALRWLRTPIPSLGDETPQAMLERDGGIERVEDVLGRMEHGVWQVIVYRIGSSRFLANDGTGASLYPGRWNPRGVSVIYTAQNSSLCALEILASARELASDYVVVKIEIPESVTIHTLTEKDLPTDWNAEVHPESTRTIGAEWVTGGTTAVLCVPSTVNRYERNFVLNPARPDFSLFSFSNPAPF